MNMKKIMAGVVASALAVSAMAVATSAAAEDVKIEDTYTLTLTADKINTGEDGWYAQIQMGHVPGFKSITIAYESADESGYLDISTGWGNNAVTPANGYVWESGFNSWDGAALTAPEGSALTVENAADYTLTVTVVIDGEDFINQWYSEEIQAQNYGEMTSEGVIIFKLGNGTSYVDGFGTVYGKVSAAGEDEPTATGADDGEDDNNAASDDNGSTNTATDDKQNADTGVEGVAVVAGLAIIAAGAVVVAKKRG